MKTVLGALRDILEIGKRDMSNPKYDGYFEAARDAIAKAQETDVIRIWIKDGLVQAVEGLPDSYVLRKIDMDVEGSDESDGVVDLDGPDLPPWLPFFDSRSGKNPPEPVSAFVDDMTNVCPRCREHSVILGASMCEQCRDDLKEQAAEEQRP